jgi:butyryl-CoA dehydrogenase
MIRYAKERTAFGKAIAEFGLIQRKISTSAARLYASESMAYRTIGMIDSALSGLPESAAKEPKEIQKKIEEYAVECSVLKVYASEMMGYVADELVATMAGYGYVEDYPAERVYRDARINRIFEGTNEINRLIVTGWLMKRALKGQLPLLPAIKKLMDEVMQPPSFDESDGASDALTHEAEILAAVKKLALFAAGVASQKYMAALEEQQEIMADLADAIAQVFALESCILRARKMTGKAGAKVAAQMTGLIAEEALTVTHEAAKRVLAASAEGDELRTQLAILRRLGKSMPAETVALSRAVAKQCIALERYAL